ncbi:MAG: prephenate dehydratase [Lachnospirales bacterium]
MKVGYLGPRGTFTEQAAKIMMPKDELIPYHSFSEALKAVNSDELDCAVVPIENSIEGIVNQTVDCLIFDVNLYIQKLLILPINQCFITKFGADLENITKIYSHSHAIPQCKKYISEKYPKADTISASSTAEAIKFVANSSDNIAGIGNKMAAELYGLQVVEDSIQDTDDNFTMFIKVEKKESFDYESGKKITLCFSTANEPGALYKLLDIFSIFDINMSKIYSRPMKNKPMEYIFFIDIEIENNVNDIRDALKLIERKTTFFKNLGSYNVIDMR